MSDDVITRALRIALGQHLQRPPYDAPGLMGAAPPDYRQQIANALMGPSTANVNALLAARYGSNIPAPRGMEGLRSLGNIDVYDRPQVRNADGSISTVRSMSVGFGDGEYLIPTVSDDGRIMGDDEAVNVFRQTGRHLGQFDTPENATRFSDQLHNDQAKYYRKRR
jgi:hypothetical protein